MGLFGRRRGEQFFQGGDIVTGGLQGRENAFLLRALHSGELLHNGASSGPLFLRGLLFILAHRLCTLVLKGEAAIGPLAEGSFIQLEGFSIDLQFPGFG